VHDSEAEVLLKGIESPVAVEQSMALAETEGCDQTVHGLADGDALGAEVTVVQCGGQGEGFAASREEFEVGELAVYALCIGVRPKALQNLAEDEVSEA